MASTTSPTLCRNEPVRVNTTSEDASNPNSQPATKSKSSAYDQCLMNIIAQRQFEVDEDRLAAQSCLDEAAQFLRQARQDAAKLRRGAADVLKAAIAEKEAAREYRENAEVATQKARDEEHAAAESKHDYEKTKNALMEKYRLQDANGAAAATSRKQADDHNARVIAELERAARASTDAVAARNEAQALLREVQVQKDQVDECWGHCTAELMKQQERTSLATESRRRAELHETEARNKVLEARRERASVEYERGVRRREADQITTTLLSIHRKRLTDLATRQEENRRRQALIERQRTDIITERAIRNDMIIRSNETRQELLQVAQEQMDRMKGMLAALEGVATSPQRTTGGA